MRAPLRLRLTLGARLTLEACARLAAQPGGRASGRPRGRAAHLARPARRAGRAAGSRDDSIQRWAPWCADGAGSRPEPRRARPRVAARSRSRPRVVVAQGGNRRSPSPLAFSSPGGRGPSAKRFHHEVTDGFCRSSARRSRSVLPPQTPNSIRLSKASARHSATTGHPLTHLLSALLGGAAHEQRVGVPTRHFATLAHPSTIPVARCAVCDIVRPSPVLRLPHSGPKVCCSPSSFLVSTKSILSKPQVTYGQHGDFEDSHLVPSDWSYRQGRLDRPHGLRRCSPETVIPRQRRSGFADFTSPAGYSGPHDLASALRRRPLPGCSGLHRHRRRAGCRDRRAVHADGWRRRLGGPCRRRHVRLAADRVPSDHAPTSSPESSPPTARSSPPLRPEPDHRAAQGGRADHAGRPGGHRGQPVLRARRFRRQGHLPWSHRPAARRAGPRWLLDHPAVRQDDPDRPGQPGR